MKKENNIINKQIKPKPQIKNINENLNDLDSNNYNNDMDYENNMNYNEENESNNIISENNESVSKSQKIYKEDERPIKPMKNSNFMNNQNPFGLSESGFPEDHKYNNNRRISNKGKIKRNKMNNKQNNKIKEEEEKQIINQDNYIENNNYDLNNNNNNNNIYNKNYSSYDERPIGGNKIDYNAMFNDNNNNFEVEGFGETNQQININVNKKKIIKKNSPKKKPVYDARKAIEEAKLKEAKEGKKERPSAFREFVREMKKISAEEKAAKMGENSPKLSKNDLKNKKIKKNNIQKKKKIKNIKEK